MFWGEDDGFGDWGADLADGLPVLETERLVLRVPRAEDAADLFSWASDPEVTRWTTWETQREPEDAEGFISWARRAARRGDPPTWFVTLRGEDRAIGTCGIVTWDRTHRRCEVGYALARPHWGRGYTPEATRAVLGHAFGELGMHRAEAVCAVGNPASARVLEKVGMRREGTLRDYLFAKGRFLDVQLYAVLREEFQG